MIICFVRKGVCFFSFFNICDVRFVLVCKNPRHKLTTLKHVLFLISLANEEALGSHSGKL